MVIILLHTLRMPLHTERKRMSLQFDPFRDTVFAPGIQAHVFSGLGNRLMVKAVDSQRFFPDDPVQKRIPENTDLVDDMIPRRSEGRSMYKADLRNLVRDIAVKLSARSHIHDLCTPADPEDRPAGIISQPGKPDLQLIPDQAGFSDRRMIFPAVTFRFHIAAADQQQTVKESGQQGMGV